MPDISTINVNGVDADIVDSGAARLEHTHQVEDITDFPSIPTELVELIDDSGHRTVSDTEKATWNAKADISAVYTKPEINTLLVGKADVSTTYTKSETDALLDNKANSSAVYTKAETDTLVGAKADTSTTYSKTETDTLLSAKADTTAIPTAVSDLTNDSGYQTAADVATAIDNALGTVEDALDELIGGDSE